MEFNRTTEDINFTTEQSGVMINVLSEPYVAVLKLLKNKNNFFTSYKLIENKEAIAENQNIIALHKDEIRNNKLKENTVRVIRIPNKPLFHIILLPKGIVIDTRRIKTKPNETIDAFTGMKMIYIYVYVIKKTINEYKRTIIIYLD